MRQAFEGAPAGTGAIYTWTGNKQVGEGRMTVTESRPNELIRIRLEFLEALRGHQHGRRRLQAGGQSNRRDVEHVG